MAASLSQHGITLTFNGGYTVGQYPTGDYYIIGPLTITGIDPPSETVDEVIDGVVIGPRTINGAMINPAAGQFVSQGFDSRMNEQAPPGSKYVSALNVARPGGNSLSPANPLVVPNGSSLVVSISKLTHTSSGLIRPSFTDMAIFTVLAAPPAPGSFRPSYCGSDKTHYWNVADLDYSMLRNLPAVSGTPSLSTVEAYFSRPWIEIGTATDGRYYHPVNHQPDYGRDLSWLLEEGLLSLHLNYTEAEKETLFVRLVQYGLDVFGAAKAGGYWADLGGFNMGRKMPMLLAALALGDADILAMANAQSTSPNGFRFQEDLQTWYVSAVDVGRAMHQEASKPRETYRSEDIGVAEWGEQHTGAPNRDDRRWEAVYRNTCYTSMTGHALFAHMTPGAIAAWNWPAFFDYIDRAKGIATDKEYGVFTRNMWTAYRNIASAASSPVFSPPAGFYESTRSVAITSATEGATIHYTTNGGTPTTASAVYAGPITVSATQTVKAIAVRDGIADSAASSAAYVIDTSGKPAPVTGLRLV